MKNDQNQNDEWNLEALYPNVEAWGKDFDEVETMLDVFPNYVGRLGSREVLLDCFESFYCVIRRIEKLYEFANRKSDQDLGNSVNGERLGKIRDFIERFCTATAFIDPELSNCDGRYLTGLLNDVDFADYSMRIKGVFLKKPYLLSEVEEALLASLANSFDAPKRISSQARNVDMIFNTVQCKGEKKELTDANYPAFLQDQNRGVRRRAMKSMLEIYGSHRSMFAEALGAHIKGKVGIAKARGYKHVLELFLHGKGIPMSVHEMLFNVTNDHLHLLHRYCKMRKRIMKVRELHWYDLYVPIVKGVSRNYTYEEAVGLVIKSVKPLGREYVDVLQRGLTTDRWVHKYPSKGKRGGAYSAGFFDSLPYILTNFDGGLIDAYTLGHEGGHSMHTRYACGTQPYPKADYVIFLAEIASTLNERLLSAYLLKSDDKKMRAFILNKQLEAIRLTFFRQTMFAEFEALLYNSVWKGRTLTADFIEDEYYKLNQRYYGSEVIVDDLIKHEWSRIPHFYLNFYVFQYATGIAAAAYFSKKILEGGADERENYFDMLKAGGSDYPVDILRNVGLDVTKPDYLVCLMNEFGKILDELDELVG